MRIDFRGKTVLITGATRGIGKQLADDCARLGADLILTGTKQDEVRRLNELRNTDAEGSGKYYCVDFTNIENVESFLMELGKLGKIDVCINNAGINRINYIDETRMEDWDDIVSVNLKAPFMIIRSISGNMKKNGYGRIVNISSIFGVVSREKRSIYTMSKFGLAGLTVSASIELASYGVLVNTVSPGFVLTDLTRNILSEAEIQELTARIPARRMGTPEDISRAVLFLASDLNSYITGQNVIVDGGYVNL